MTRTFGQVLVNDLLPKDLQTTDPLDKKGIHNRLYTLARRNPSEAAKAMDQIRQLGHEIATTEGASITLDDITPDYKTRNKILKPVLKSIQNTSDPTKRKQAILRAQEKLLKTVPAFGGSQGMMLRSGTRGAPTQLMRSFLAPVAARDATGDSYPWLVHHSYSEGLRPSEHWATSMESRNNLLAANLAIREPGDFAKILVNNMGDQLVLKEDCGTTNGIEMKTDDPNIIDRFLAKPVNGFRGGSLVTPQVFSELRKKKVPSITVRSPMTCELNDGVCQKCQGLNEHGQLHTIGTNIGIRAAQAMTEPLTQFTLSARHGVRAAGSDASQIKGLKELRQFLEIPKTFMNKAILAEKGGKIEKIQKAPQGGFNIFIGGTAHYAPPSVTPTVRVGQKVAPGDALSDGIPKPDEVVKFKGMGAGRKYMVDQLHGAFLNQGVDLDKRHFEVLARTHLNHVQIDDDPEERFYPGEVVNYSTLLKTLSKDTEKRPLKEAQGQMLARNYLHHTAGTVLSPEIAKELSKNGIKDVSVVRRPPKVSVAVHSIVNNPLLNPNWMARMGHRKIKSTILEAAQFAEKADIHGTHPVPGFAYGAEFGKGPGGRY